MRLMFINDSTTNSNWGDRAAALSLRAMIEASDGTIEYTITERDLGLSSFEGHAANSEEHSPTSARDIARVITPAFVRRARRRFVKNADLTRANRVIPERWEDFEKAALRVLRGNEPGWPELLAAIAHVDAAVIHGNGAMWGSGVIPRTDLFLTYLIKKHFRRAVIIVNHTVDFSHPVLLRMAKNVYPLFDDVVYRDPLSAQRYSTLLGGRFAADSAFWFEPAPREAWAPIAGRPTYFDVWPDKAAFDPSCPYICVGGSSLLCTDWRPVEIARDYGALIQHLRSVYGGQIVLTVSGLQELEVFRPLAIKFELPMVAPTIPVQQAVDILGNAEAYVGGRWHSAIFALRGGAPVVALSAKQSKMESLMLSAGLPATAFDAFNLALHQEAIGSALLNHLGRGAELRCSLRSWADSMSDNCWDNVAYIERRRPSPNSHASEG